MNGKGFLKEKLFFEDRLDSSPWNPEEEKAIKQEIKDSNAKILAQYPPAMMAKLIEDRLKKEEVPAPQRKRPPADFWKRVLQAVPIAAAAGVALFLSGTFFFSKPEEPSERLKGFEPRMLVYKKTASEAVPLEDQTWVGPGDQLRLGYTSAGQFYGALFSLDGKYQITLHFPESGPKAAPLAKGEILFPWSYELDSAPNFERFYFVTSEKPFELAPLLETIKSGPQNPLNFPGLKIQILHLNKRSLP